MSDLIVLAFKTEGGATAMRDKLLQLQKQHLISLEDAAVVIRRADGKVKVKQLHSLVGAGALGGAFWGMLIGLIFWMPWLGLAIGAAGGALGGHFSDVGVDDKFIANFGERTGGRKYKKMDPDTRRMALKLYENEIREFSKLIGRELDWLDADER